MDFEEFKEENEEKIENKFKALGEFIRRLKIKVINCLSISGIGITAHVELGCFDESLIVDDSICFLCINVVKNDDLPFKSLKYLIGEIRGTSVYIRLGATDTWLSLKANTLIGEFLEKCHEKAESDDYLYDYDDDEGEESDEDIDPENFDDEDLNRLAAIVAKSKGFNLLKNREQRKKFSKSTLVKAGEEFDEYYLDRIATVANDFYEFGVLPLAAKALQVEGKSESEIAKALGHTKAKVEKALLIEVDGEFLEILENTDLST